MILKQQVLKSSEKQSEANLNKKFGANLKAASRSMIILELTIVNPVMHGFVILAEKVLIMPAANLNDCVSQALLISLLSSQNIYKITK